MSTQKHIIEIAPLEYRTEHERITFRNFTCPLCNGRGGYTVYEGRDRNVEPCDLCDGTGKLRAEVLIHWKPDYGD